MRYKFNVEIPYGKRNRYFEFIVAVNDLVTSSGMVSLWVNNNPYSLQSFLLVETNENGAEISELVKKYGLKNDTSKGIDEYLSELSIRKWNTMTIMGGRISVGMAYGLYEFADEDVLEKNGYKQDDRKRNKIFISYCHKNKDAVLEYVDKMEKAGLYLWIDKQEIDAGDNILEKIMSGIEESDLCITFVSKATVEAQFARHELTTIWHKVIYNKKKWFIVKLDDVDIEEIYCGLSQYLYYDIHDSSDTEDLINAVERKLSKMK